MDRAAENVGTGGPDCWYRLDPGDHILDVGGAWDSGAAGRVAGTSIYDHVAGHFTRKFLKDFLRRARIAHTLVRQCYRCDSPDTKRLMEMRAEAEGDGVLRVNHALLGARALPFAVHVREVPRPIASRLRCSSCNRLRRKGADVWLEPEEATRPGETTLVVHTVCPECRKKIQLRRQASIFNLAGLKG
jgi:ribosomal protein L37AE/L43A